MTDKIEPVAGRFHDFTLEEAIEIAKRNDPGEKVPSTSRTFMRTIDALAQRAERAEAEAAGLREDAERWRHFRFACHYYGSGIAPSMPEGMNMVGSPQDLDTEIDAAISAARGDTTPRPAEGRENG